MIFSMSRSTFILRSLAVALACAVPAVGVQEPSQSSRSSQQKQGKQDKSVQLPTAEQVAELVIAYNGQRAVLQQVRRSGVERGIVTRPKEDGGTEEITYERRFMRGESSAKDKVRFDQKTPANEFSLLFKDGKLSGVINGVNFTPRQETQSEFLAAARHDVEALLRYKENKSQLALVGKEKQKNIDMYVLDLTDAENRRTRFYISTRSAHVLWLEYEEPNAPGTSPVKYKREFHDYIVVQGTLVPYRVVTYADGKLIDQKQVRSVVYGIKVDETVFDQAPTNART